MFYAATARPASANTEQKREKKTVLVELTQREIKTIREALDKTTKDPSLDRRFSYTREWIGRTERLCSRLGEKIQ